MSKIVFAIAFLILCSFKSSAIKIDSLKYGAFGKIKIYHPDKTPTSVAIFVSGDGGWQFGVINMAKNIARQGALVLGIDAKHYRSSLSKQASKCYYPASDFENLSLMIQKKYKFPTYQKPVLIGYSYGATLVYGILSQAPANTFKGAIAIGFCPDIELKKPLCRGSGLNSHVLKRGVSFYLDQTTNLTASFIVLNGLLDKECDYAKTQLFLKGVKNAQFVGLPKVGHGFSIADNWLPQFNNAYKQILNNPALFDNNKKPFGSMIDTTFPKYSSNLPLTVVKAAATNTLPFIFMISGDGGWTSFDQSMAEAFAKNGYDVVGLDAQTYFWNEKSPKKASQDIVQALNYYREKLNKNQFILAGYSFGASIIPFIANRLPVDLKPKLKNVFALSPDEYADFEIHLSDMLNFGNSKGKYNVLKEFNAMKASKPVCFFGMGEDQDITNKFIKSGILVVNLPGGHHYDDDFSKLASEILRNLK